MVGTSASRIATNLISFTCKGRGFALPDELAAMATKFNGIEMQKCVKIKNKGVSFLRPLRDYLSKEIAIYNRHCNLTNPMIVTFDTKGNAKFSIDHLAESKINKKYKEFIFRGFIENLQVEFLHTVHTLLRSSSKLYTPQQTVDFRCAICAR